MYSILLSNPSRTAVFVFAILTLLVWGAWENISQRNDASIKVQTSFAAKQFSARIEEFIKARTNGIELLVEEMADENKIDRDKYFRKHSAFLQQRFPGFQALNWVDADRVIRLVVPEEKNKAAIGLDIKKLPVPAKTIEEAFQKRGPVATPPIELAQGVEGFVIYYPVFRDDKIQGYVNAVFNLTSLMNQLFITGMGGQYRLSIQAQGKVFFEIGNFKGKDDFSVIMPLLIAGQSWVVKLTPSGLVRVENYAFIVAMLATISFSLALRAVLQSQLESRRNQNRLKEAVESIPESFVLYDNNGRLVLCNDRFKELYQYRDEEVKVGVHFIELGRLDIERGVIAGGDQQQQEYYDDRVVGSAKNNKDTFAVEMADGRHILVRERSTIQGDRVSVQTDITHIKQVQEELKEAHDELEKRVQERTQEFLAAKLDAEKANLAKTEFLSRMSHEFRTPLNGILGFAQLLDISQSNPEPEDNRVYISQILSAGDHLLELVNEILDLSRVEAGTIQLSLEAIDAKTVLEQSLSLVSPIADKANINLVFDWPTIGALPLIYGDSTRLKQIFVNLISNAIKYNKDKGQVEVRTEKVGDDRVRFFVSDTGYGIEKEKLSEIFQPFNRLDAEGSSIEGAGVGLTIAQKFTELMDGKMGVESTVGEGSVFWVELAVAKNVELIPEKRAKVEKHKSKPRQGVGDILYIEDNLANQKLMEAIITAKLKSKIVIADTAEKGLEILDDFKPALILLDINLPGMDGYEAIKIIKTREDLRDIPVIAVSANALAVDIEKGMAAGFSDYLTKPINVNMTVEIIEKVMGL